MIHLQFLATLRHPMQLKPESLLKKAPLWGQRIWSHRDLWIRALFCWFVGLMALWSEEASYYDRRFQVRGNLNNPTNIRTLLVSHEDWSRLQNPSYNWLKPLKELGSITESDYWDEDRWENLLSRLLVLNPQAIGVTFFFGENIPDTTPGSRTGSVFEDPRIIWAARLDSEGRLKLPRFSKLYGQNSGLIHLMPDIDGILRRSMTTQFHLNDFSYALAMKTRPDFSAQPFQSNRIINFQGYSSYYPQLTLKDVVDGKILREQVEGKVILIGARDGSGHEYLTPMGPMSRAEVIAHDLETLTEKRQIQRASTAFYAIGLLALIVLNIWIISFYPQMVAFVILLSLNALLASISTWLFDEHSFWIPIVSPSIQSVIALIIFVSYQAVRNEQKAQKLEEEKRLLTELETMKNNFMSLISHDLKTPIAKIQAVSDRLLRDHAEAPFQQDLHTLKNSGQDLYRYIQSVLYLSRVEAKAFRLNLEASDINEIVLEVIRELKPLAQEKNIQISEQLEPLFSLELDAKLIHEVLINLIENAIKYTPPGGSVTVESREINDDVILRVKDTGDGIAPEEMLLVWDKFFRGKKHGMVTKGTGLGLYLVKYFVELHGGSVFIESTPGQGTEVGFRIPVQSHKSQGEAV